MTDPVLSVDESDYRRTEKYSWPDGYIELRWVTLKDTQHELDEFVLQHPRALVHYESMSNNHVWMAITIGDWSIDFNWGGKNLSMLAEVNV
jgi:hypothetical protein